MWNLIIYIVAVIVGLVLFYLYHEEQDECSAGQQSDSTCNSPASVCMTNDFRLSSLFTVLGLSVPGETCEEQFEAFTENFTTFDEVARACWLAGLASSSLVIGVDFSASNEWKGRKSFSQNCLHRLIGTKIANPYQKVISILGQTLAPFDDDNKIPVYGFGDTVTQDHSVFPFRFDEKPCSGFEEVLEFYNEVVRRVALSGPSSLAPIINKAVSIVHQTRKYHILVIITDGAITEELKTAEAVIDASNVPLSIIAVGVGDGPWDILERFDTRLPRRKFDNFRFVDYHKATAKTKNPDQAFALQALMEIPDQYKRITELGYLDGVPGDADRQCNQPKFTQAGVLERSSTRNSPMRVVEKCRHRLSTMSW